MTEFAQWYYEKSVEIMTGVGAHTNEKLQEFMQDVDDLEGLDISFIQVAHAFNPDPITPAGYMTRGPYGNPDAYEQAMHASVERGWLEPDGERGYVLSEQGRDLARRFIDFGNELFSGLQGLSEDENKRIANLLKQIVLKARELTNLDKKPALEIGRRLEPGPKADPMVRIRRYMTDIAYFREAAHIQSWQPHGVKGIVWETLTYLWREGPQTAAEIAEQISEYRNYDKEDYAAALDELAVRGWAAGEDGKYTITEEGKRIRQGAEDKTDALYAAPFEALTKPDSQELKNHLEKLAGVIVPPSEEDEDDD